MICYLVRHGQDDETRRGGWSDLPLTGEGIRQAELLAENLSRVSIGKIYSSDLCRAIQTAKPLADKRHLSIIPLKAFREVNNGDLAGMENSLALVKYPGLFWNQLGWEQCYPNGESPKQFCERIQSAWISFSKEVLAQNENVVLVTHGGVIHVIRAMLEDRQYSNRDTHKKVRHAEVIALSCEGGIWREI